VQLPGGCGQIKQDYFIRLDLKAELAKCWLQGDEMLLVLNAIRDEENIQRFESGVRDQIFRGEPVDFVKLEELPVSLGKYSHLLISGSGLSIEKGSEWDGSIFRVIEHFIKRYKAILGICYGHQVLAYHLGGKSCVRVSERPQFGFREIYWDKNRFYSGKSRFWGMVAHLDEVHDLPSEFRIIARDGENVIQGFQYGSRNIWGLQFHPEYNYFGGLASWERKERAHPEWRRFFKNTVTCWADMDDNPKMISRFLRL
jgi:GMP synthase (glutamine-hydrolysing)